MVVLWVALAVFVVGWVFDVFSLRGFVPAWLPFLVALGLELRLFLSRGSAGPRPRGRMPLEVDRERYGYGDDGELLLVRDRERDVWLPYSGESADEVDALVAEGGEAV